MLPGYVLRVGEAFLCIFKMSSKLPNPIKEGSTMNITSRQQQPYLSQVIFGLGFFLADRGMTYKDTLHYSFSFVSKKPLYLTLTKPIGTYKPTFRLFQLIYYFYKINDPKFWLLVGKYDFTCHNNTPMGSENPRV